MKRITIKDLAKMLSLSTSTVSRALTDHPDISNATKERVREIADRFNYTTNMHARFFRKQNSGLIALILPEVNMFFTPNLMKGINKVIDASKYSLIIFVTNDSYKKEVEMIKQCVGWAVQGVLLSVSKETYNLDHLEILNKAEISTMLFDRVIESKKFPSVSIDSVDASFNAVSKLISMGHKNILGIFGEAKLAITQKRKQGYKKALIENGLHYIQENEISVIKSTDLDIIVPAILNHNKTITAIFTMTDELLIRTLYNINTLGLKIPHDISIISISDGDFPLSYHPNITHIKDSGIKTGKTASKLLLNAIDNKDFVLDNWNKVSTKLVEMDSIMKIE